MTFHSIGLLHRINRNYLFVKHIALITFQKSIKCSISHHNRWLVETHLSGCSCLFAPKWRKGDGDLQMTFSLSVCACTQTAIINFFALGGGGDAKTLLSNSLTPEPPSENFHCLILKKIKAAIMTNGLVKRLATTM